MKHFYIEFLKVTLSEIKSQFGEYEFVASSIITKSCSPPCSNIDFEAYFEEMSLWSISGGAGQCLKGPT